MTATTNLTSALDAQRERSRAQVAQYHQIRAALETLRVSASSSDRSVTVDLAAGGAIVDLHLTDQAMAKTPQTLAGTILEAIRLGLAEVAKRTAESVEPLTGRRVDVTAIARGRLPSLDAVPQAPASSEPSSAEAKPPRFSPEED